MDLMLVTNDVAQGAWCQAHGVERVLVDLEIQGKAERQHGAGLFLSHHTLSDVSRLRAAIGATLLQVRVDRWHDDSALAITDVIECGADIVMVSMIESVDQARAVVDAVARRARVTLLVETGLGIAAIDELVGVEGIDEVHVGLNDLQLSTGRRVPFEAIADGTIDPVAARVSSAGLGFGVGGVTSPLVADLPVSALTLLGEQVRLGTTVAWLGRSFQKLLDDEKAFTTHVNALRAAERHWRVAPRPELEANRTHFGEAVRAWAEASQNNGGSRLRIAAPTPPHDSGYDATGSAASGRTAPVG